MEIFPTGHVLLNFEKQILGGKSFIERYYLIFVPVQLYNPISYLPIQSITKSKYSKCTNTVTLFIYFGYPI